VCLFWFWLHRDITMHGPKNLRNVTLMLRIIKYNTTRCRDWQPSPIYFVWEYENQFYAMVLGEISSYLLKYLNVFKAVQNLLLLLLLLLLSDLKLLSILVNNQLDALFQCVYLFHFSTCFEQPSAHHQENQLYQYIIWYVSFCVGDCLLRRSGGTGIPGSSLHSVKYARCCINTI
jgi:hypothetical protein